MANYALSVNSTFQPFTYQELAAPLDRQELYHEKLADEYDKLSTQADVLEVMGANDRDKNSGSYSKYKSYSDALRKEADELYRFGLNSESRQRLSDLRRRYNTDIVPIQNAWNKRDEESKMQLQASLQNPSLMFTRDAQNTSLDEYVRNPQGGFGIINGANITKQMSDMAKNLAKQIRNGSATKESIDPYTYNYIQRYGLDENLIRNWQDSPTLKAMYDQVMRANGVTPEALEGSMNANSILSNSRGYAEMGMWNAMGEDKASIQEDFLARLQANTASQIDAAVAKELAKHGIGDGAMPNIPSIAVGVTPTEEYKSKNLEVLNSLKGGQDAFKRSYFGNTLGQVNPLAIYEEYDRELKKNTRIVGAGAYAKPVGDTKQAKETVLNKYRKYGVTDVLSKEQYEALKSAGYSSKEKFSAKRHSDVLKGFNKSVEQRSRYSTNMTDYDSFNEKALPNLRTRETYNSKGTVWAIGDDGKISSPESVKDLGLYSADNTKGNKITDVQYDPQFKGKIVIQLSDGTVHVADPSIYDSNLTNMIIAAENQKAHPQAITARIYDFLNKKNKVQGKTDSKLE